MKFNIDLEIEAQDEQELAEKLQAFQDLQDNLEHEDLMQATDVLMDNPEIVDFIKEVAPQEGKELGWADYLRIAKKAFQKFG